MSGSDEENEIFFNKYVGEASHPRDPQGDSSHPSDPNQGVLGTSNKKLNQIRSATNPVVGADQSNLKPGQPTTSSDQDKPRGDDLNSSIEGQEEDSMYAGEQSNSSKHSLRPGGMETSTDATDQKVPYKNTDSQSQGAQKKLKSEHEVEYNLLYAKFGSIPSDTEYCPNSEPEEEEDLEDTVVDDPEILALQQAMNREYEALQEIVEEGSESDKSIEISLYDIKQHELSIATTKEQATILSEDREKRRADWVRNEQEKKE